MKNKWISVKDELPEYDVPVLLACEDYTYDAVFRRTQGIRNEYWDRNDSDGEGNYHIYSPDYWMPLPEPPKDNT